MRCPSCGYEESKVIDSRSADDGSAIRRRRECLKCQNRFTTYERLGERPVIVLKSDGSQEAFDRQKLFRGLLIACAKRSIGPETIDQLIDDIENSLRNSGTSEVRSKALGEMVLERLAGIDDVAYIRFASVYKDFKDAREFGEALEGLR